MATEIHLAIMHDDGAIVASGTDFLKVLAAAPDGAFLTTETWLTSGQNRKAKMLAAMNKTFFDWEDQASHRVDLAIEELRRLGVKCQQYTSQLLRESHYGQLPAGSAAAMAINVGELA